MFNLNLVKTYLTTTNLAIALAVVVVAVSGYLYMRSSSSAQTGGASDEKAVVVLYYAPWCPHCKDIMPMWENLKNKHASDSKLEVKKVDCEAEPEEASKNDVKAFPTIILFKNGEKVQYEGERNEEAVENFVSSH